ncbi:type II toxin-antitoxin system death-on-curing family toxin [Nostoc sp. ChiSLP03a]|nr:type II toxin-antitoxin system death-on-curing family toxin [Nostoc sp. ChiSLP03a]MDZ8216289.1 type II toxin-antitoxin system death-on-curing family toxin [Nostoc sp. ChiSLP03a]
MATNHPFIDGNKRTAFAVMLTFLSLNGYTLDASQEQAYNLVIQVV